MPDFSIIVQDPKIRKIVQDRTLERGFHDTLFPKILFRAAVQPEEFPGNLGDSMFFSADGLIEPDGEPLAPGDEPDVATYDVEQWQVTMQQYAKSIDTDMPTTIVAIANLFYRNMKKLGEHAARSLNRVVRNRLYNAAEAGWTVADGAQAGVTSFKVKSLNGFTRARRPDLVLGSPVAYEKVSSDNPLSITIFDNAAEATFSVIGYTPDNPGDEVGPGKLTLSVAVTNVLNRAYVFSSDRTNIVRVGGGNKIDSIDAADVLTLAAIRSAVARFRMMTVPEMPDMKFHAHLDPISEAQIFGDPEFQRLNQSLPEASAYKDFCVANVLGTLFFRNNECPLPETVRGAGLGFNKKDNFGGELFNAGTTGVRVHRVLFYGQDFIKEYYIDQSKLITEAGLLGKAGEFQVTTNGIEINTDRIQLVIRGPIDRLQQKVSCSYNFLGDWSARPDGLSGDAARMKRVLEIQHGE